METKIPELLVTAGPLKDQRFTVTEAGIRLGRSSSCEISIPDPALLLRDFHSGSGPFAQPVPF